MTIMKKNIFLLAVTLLLIGFASCSDEDTKPIIPSDVIDLSADTQDKPGYIVLRWATPDDNTIRYIKVSYYDYLLEQDVVRLASVYADSVLIPDTRKKFGEYEFKVQSYSETGDAGNVQTIKAVSEPAPVQVVFGAGTISGRRNVNIAGLGIPRNFRCRQRKTDTPETGASG